MKRTLTLTNNLILRKYSQKSWSICFEITYDDISALILEFQMIVYRLTQSVILLSPKGEDSVNILLNEKEESEITKDSSKLNILLSQKDIEFVISYLLQYYRDYCAPVSHIDIELVHKGLLGQDATLVIKASDVIEPMTEEDARKMLGM